MTNFVYALCDPMQPMFVNGTCPGKRKTWKTLEFGLCKSSKILEKDILISYEPCNVKARFDV